MKRFIGSLVIGSAILTGGTGAFVYYDTAPDMPDVAYSVRRIVDGDTFVVAISGRDYKVRMLGVDTNETHHPRKSVECWGPEAEAFTRSSLEGKKVYLDVDQNKRSKDLYGRLLRYVKTNPQRMDFNETLLEQGYAKYNPYGKIERAAIYKNAETYAKTNKIGLWRNCPPPNYE